MPLPNITTPDIQRALKALLPPGAVWPRDADSVQSQVFGALAPTYARLTARDGNLLTDAFPTTTLELLPEWEASVGLPDICTPLNPTTQQRVAAVAAKVLSLGGQSPAYYIAVAAALGFAVTITQFMPFCADMACELPDYDPLWLFVWQVNAPQITTFYFSADEASADDALETYDNTELSCRLAQIAPAHTTLLFAFS